MKSQCLEFLTGDFAGTHLILAKFLTSDWSSQCRCCIGLVSQKTRDFSRVLIYFRDNTKGGGC